MNSQTLLSGGDGLTDAGTVRVTVSSDSTGVLSIDDNGGAITVDWAGTAPPIGAGTEAAALRVTLATDSTGVITVDNAGTFAVQIDSAAVTALQLIDDIVYTDDTSTHATGTSKGAGIMAAATPTDGTVGANDIGMLAMSLDRRLHVDADITASVALDVSAATVTVDLGANNDVTIDPGAVTSLALIDDVVATLGTTTYLEATTKANLVGVVRNDTLATLASLDNEIAPLQVNASGALYIQEGSALDVSAATITVAAHAVTNAGTFAVQVDGDALTALQLIDNAVSGAGFNITQMNGVNVTMGNGVSGTGVQRVTIASDTTGVLSIDDNGGSLTIDGTVTANAGTGTMTVTDDGSFTLAANSGVDIGDVDVLSVVPGTGATNLGKAIDSASGATDTGIASLAIRDDSLSALTPIEGDYAPLRVNSTGALHVTGGGGGAEFNVDDVAGGTDAGSLMLVVRDDALTTLTPIDGDYTQLRVNSTGALHVTGAGGGTQYSVDDAGPTVVTMAGAVRDDSLTTLTEVDGDATLLRVSSTGALHVTGGGGGTEYTQDVAHADPATAAAWLLPRDDVLSTQETTDGDWTLPRANARGAQWVELDLTNDVTIADGGNSITVDGTVTATHPQLGGGTESGAQRVTIASDSTGVLSIDDNSGSLTVDSSDLVTIAGAVSGTEMQVDIVSGGGGTEYVVNAAAPADPTGTASLMERDDALSTLTEIAGDWTNMRANARGALWVELDLTTDVTISDGGNVISTDWDGTAPPIGAGTESTALRVTLATDSTGVVSIDDNGGSLTIDGTVTLGANSGVDVGDVDVTSVLPGSGATNLGKAIDAPAGATDTGVASLAVRDDALTTLTPVDGDYVPLRVNSTGALHVTGGGGGTEYVVNAAAPADPTGSASLMERDDALSTLTEVAGDWTNQRANARGAMWVELDLTNDVTIADGGNSITVDGTVTVTHPQLGAGTESGAQRVTIANDSTGVLSIDDNGGAITVDNGGTFSVQIDSGAVTSLALIDNPVVAHDAAVSGSTGVSILGLEARSTEPSAVADADATRGIATLLGKQVTLPYAIPASTWQYAAVSGGITDQADDVAKAAAGASIRNYITSVQVVNGHATINTEVVIKDGSTIIWRGFAQNSGGGVSAKFDPPLRGTANTAVNVTNITTGAATYFNLQGFIAAE